MNKMNKIRTRLLLISDAEMRLYIKTHIVRFNSITPRELANSQKSYDEVVVLNNPVVFSHHTQTYIDQYENEEIKKENIFYELMLNLVPDMNGIERMIHRNMHKKKLEPKVKRIKTSKDVHKLNTKSFFKLSNNLKMNNNATNIKHLEDKQVTNGYFNPEHIKKSSKALISINDKLNNASNKSLKTVEKITPIKINYNNNEVLRRNNPNLIIRANSDSQNNDCNFNNTPKINKSIYKSKLSPEKKLQLAEIFLPNKDKEERRIQANITKLKLIVNSIKILSTEISGENKSTPSNLNTDNYENNLQILGIVNKGNESTNGFNNVKDTFHNSLNGLADEKYDEIRDYENNSRLIDSKEIFTCSENDISGIGSLNSILIMEKINALGCEQNKYIASKFNNLYMQAFNSPENNLKQKTTKLNFSDIFNLSNNQHDQLIRRDESHPFNFKSITMSSIKKLITAQNYKNPNKKLMDITPRRVATSKTMKIPRNFSSPCKVTKKIQKKSNFNPDRILISNDKWMEQDSIISHDISFVLDIEYKDNHSDDEINRDSKILEELITSPSSVISHELSFDD